MFRFHRSSSMRSPLKKSFDILARLVPGDSWIVPFLPTLRIQLAWSLSKTERWYKNWYRQRPERQSRGLPDGQFVKRLNNQNSWKIMNFKSRNFVWKTPKTAVFESPPSKTFQSSSNRSQFWSSLRRYESRRCPRIFYLNSKLSGVVRFTLRDGTLF